MPARVKNCTGVILAGGENTRMPVLKGFIEVDSKKIIEKNLEIMKDLFEEIFIVTNQPEDYLYLGVPMLGDIYDIRGPMTGILTSLVNSSTPWVFVSACDMPFISKELIRHILSLRKGVDAVVPNSPHPHRGVKRKARGDHSQPLFACYSKRLASAMEDAVSSDKRVIKAFLSDKKVKYVTSGEIKKIDPESRSFINLNTPEDIKHFLGARDIVNFNRKTSGRKHVRSWRN